MKIETSILNKFIEENIHEFHDKRITRLLSLKLDDLLKRKNPYLFKAKSIITAQELVEGILQAYLSSQEEAIFSEILEKLAIFVNGIMTLLFFYRPEESPMRFFAQATSLIFSGGM